MASARQSDVAGAPTHIVARLLDTRDIDPASVADVVHDLFAHNVIPLDVTIDTSAPLIVDGATIAHASLLSTEVKDMSLRRDDRQTAGGIAFGIQRTGSAWFDYHDRTHRHVTAGTLFIVDQTVPYRYDTSGVTDVCSIEMEYPDLGLPVDLTHKAAKQLPRSPLYRMVMNHLLGLHRDLTRIEADPAGPAVMGATTDLLRALVASAAEIDQFARPAMAEALLPRVLAYTRQHLRDPSLTPERIARHHDISLRYLYKLCAAADIRLMDWIFEQRLEGAKRQLVRPTRRTQTIAEIAHLWGFRDASHFSERFRRRYDMTPREWRANALRGALSLAGGQRFEPR